LVRFGKSNVSFREKNEGNMRKLISLLIIVVAVPIAFAQGNKIILSATLISVFAIVLVLFFRYRKQNSTKKNLSQRENIDGFPYL